MKKFFKYMLRNPESILPFLLAGIGLWVAYDKGIHKWLIYLITAESFEINMLLAILCGVIAISLTIVVVTLILIKNSSDITNWIEKHILCLCLSSFAIMNGIAIFRSPEHTILLPLTILVVCALVICIIWMAYCETAGKTVNGKANPEFNKASWVRFYSYMYQVCFFFFSIIPWIIGFFMFFAGAAYEMGQVAAANLTNFCVGHEIHDDDMMINDE